MSTLGLVDRVRSWFGSKGASAPAGVGFAGGRWSLGPAPERAALALASAAAFARAPAMDTEPAPEDCDIDRPLRSEPRAPAGTPPLEAPPALPDPFRPHLDPIDPVWIESLDALPRRIAESVAQSAHGARALEQIGTQLEGHRETAQAIRDAVGRLPHLAADQVDLVRETNRILKRQCNLLESMFDGITALRAALRTVDESSRRHELALAELEESHHQVLCEYQTMLLKAHRRLGRLAAVAILMAAAAVGGVAYVAYRVLVASQAS
jgi:hypothetical protein